MALTDKQKSDLASAYKDVHNALGIAVVGVVTAIIGATTGNSALFNAGVIGLALGLWQLVGAAVVLVARLNEIRNA